MTQGLLPRFHLRWQQDVGVPLPLLSITMSDTYSRSPGYSSGMVSLIHDASTQSRNYKQPPAAGQLGHYGERGIWRIPRHSVCCEASSCVEEQFCGSVLAQGPVSGQTAEHSGRPVHSACSRPMRVIMSQAVGARPHSTAKKLQNIPRKTAPRKPDRRTSTRISGYLSQHCVGDSLNETYYTFTGHTGFTLL